MYRVWFVRISTHLQIGMGKIWNLAVMDEVCIYIRKKSFSSPVLGRGNNKARPFCLGRARLTFSDL